MRSNRAHAIQTLRKCEKTAADLELSTPIYGYLEGDPLNFLRDSYCLSIGAWHLSTWQAPIDLAPIDSTRIERA